MNKIGHIFKNDLLKAYLARISDDTIPEFKHKWDIIQKWRRSCIEGDLTSTKETSVQGLFLSEIFGSILGYSTVIDGGVYNQMQEFNSTLDGSEADGALGYFNNSAKLRDIRVAIELKGASISLDKKQNRSSHLTPVEQGMSYAHKNGSKCGWVIVSNFIETRLYKSNSSLEYEMFDLTKMDNKAEFIRFYYMLCKDNLISEHDKSIMDKLYQENEEIGISISNKFYGEYKEIRNDLFKHLKEYNPNKNEILLFTKSQKIMDRFTFICFCEDCGLLPQNLYKQIVDSAEHSFSFSTTRIWDQLRGLFVAIDKGNPPMHINQYNGGLFKEDSELDSLIIHDDILKKFLNLSAYNFSSDLNVNILGQIFEQSISDVEQIKNEINGVKGEKRGKQKDDGIFYTPYYVTRYIVEQTVGVYLNQKKEAIKQELLSDGGYSADIKKYSTKRLNHIVISDWTEIPALKDDTTEEEEMYREAVCKMHLEFWERYEAVLRNIKICDPSCGSGAFLNQCFDYLKEEMDFVIDIKRQLNSDQLYMFEIDRQILQNNLYGVDINQESVEITKLSLWLKTAKKHQTLATLDDNIKCGNSIVDDPNVAGELAFNWEKEFPDVFANGGFDIIVGNPPYGATLKSNQKEYISNKYTTIEGGIDTYRVFFELGIKILKYKGMLGYITPNTYFNILSGKKLRKFLLNNTLLNVVELYNVFPNAVVEPIISIYQKKVCESEKIEIVLIPRNTALSSTFISDGVVQYKEQAFIIKNEDFIFNYKINDNNDKIVSSVNNNATRLSELCYVYNGTKPYEVGKGTPPQTKAIQDKKLYNGYKKIDDTWVPYIRGKRIHRFTTLWDGEYIKYGENLAAPRSPEIFFREKIFVRQTGDAIIATIDNGNVTNNTMHIVFPKDDRITNTYLLGLLNSIFMTWYYQTTHPTEVGKPMAEVKKDFVEKLPIIIAEQSVVERVESIVNELLCKCQKRHDECRSFSNYIMKAYEPKKLTDTMLEFQDMTFKEYISELKKQKVKLTAKEQMELLELFEERQNIVKSLSDEIQQQYNELNDIVFSIYGLRECDINMIRKEIKIIL